MMRRAQPWLGTLVEIGIVPADESDSSGSPAAGAAIGAAFAAIAQVHARMSFHDRDSDVSAINRLHPGQSVAVDAHTAAVLRCALQLEAATDGIFNIACGAPLTAWQQLPAPVGAADSGRDRAAAPAGLPRAVVAIDDHCSVTRMHPGWIDLGGIAKGYAVDRAVASLLAAGMVAGCVNAGGDLRVFGPVDFPIHVRDPAQPTRSGIALLLREQALATSACYFSRRDVDGMHTSALVDGGTGQPVVHGRSASVLAPDCMLADALTKLVIASGDAIHPVLAQFSATAFLL